MPVSRSGVTSPRGFNYAPDIITSVVTYTIPASGTLLTGQPLCRDVTQIPSSAGADICVLPNNANAGTCIGVYQGPNITNPSSTATLVVDIEVITDGWGVVLAGAATAGVAVTVGGALVVASSQSVALQSASPTFQTYIGQAVATGAVTAKGATIIAVPGSGITTQLVNAQINTN